MSGALDLAAANLLSPMVLFFVLGVLAAFARSDLAIPQAAAKLLALYLMLAIGFKGGVGVAAHGIDGQLIGTLAAGIVLSFAIPWLAYAALRATTRLPQIDAGAVAAHYGSISVVTFAVAIDQLTAMGQDYEGFMVATAAAMETPAIVAGLLLAHRGAAASGGADKSDRRELFREVAFNGSIVLLMGSFAIGWITGEEGMTAMSSFIVDPFRGVLALFLLDMGLIAGRGMQSGFRDMGAGTILFGIYMPLVSAALGAVAAAMLDLSLGGAALLITLSASASYIAVPAAMRLALPEARPAIYLTLSLGVTFPFNLTLGIPIYIWAAGVAVG